MRYIRTTAVITTLCWSVFGAVFWIFGDLRPAGICLAIAGISGVLWGYLSTDEPHRDPPPRLTVDADLRPVWPAEIGGIE